MATPAGNDPWLVYQPTSSGVFAGADPHFQGSSAALAEVAKNKELYARKDAFTPGIQDKSSLEALDE